MDNINAIDFPREVRIGAVLAESIPARAAMAKPEGDTAHQLPSNMDMKGIEEATVSSGATCSMQQKNQKNERPASRMQLYRDIMIISIVALAAMRWIFPILHLDNLLRSRYYAQPLATAREPNFIFIMTVYRSEPTISQACPVLLSVPWNKC